ncbi:MAG TPA: hypothetical protein VFV78_01385 [Vicinamibacterales bacterium]|nr:hypothetical protein [Vicinamibacterales bacterium]
MTHRVTAAVVLLVAVLSIEVFALTRPSPQVPRGGAADPLAHGSNLAYEGSFKLATGGPGCPDGDSCTSNYGGGAISFDPAGDAGNGSIWVSGFANDFRVAEFRVSNIYGSLSKDHTTTAALPTAVKLSGWTDATGGRTADAHASSRRIYGIYKFGGDLFVNVGGYFGYNQDAAGKPLPSLFRTRGDLTGTISGPFFISGDGTAEATCGGSNSCKARWTSGGIFPIPPAWQPILGGTHAVGGCCRSIIGDDSSGPSLTTFNMADVDRLSPIPSFRLLGYPSAGGFSHETLGNWNGDKPGTGDWIQAMTESMAGVWLPGTRTILFSGTRGTVANGAYGHAVAHVTDGFVEDAVNHLYSDWPQGSDASTDATGCHVTLPYANLMRTGAGSVVHPNHANYAKRPDQAFWVWLKDQATPIQDFPVRSSATVARKHRGVAAIQSASNSGAADASVTVTPCFPGRLSGQPYVVGELTLYDPPDLGMDTKTANANKGPHAYPYSCGGLMFDANDLAKVKAGGRARYWDPVPYETWDCAGTVAYPGDNPFRQYHYGGSTFDTIHNKYLLVQMWADAGRAAIVQVYGYTAPKADPSTATRRVIR